jgi:lysyl-tRNA synthetase class 1
MAQTEAWPYQEAQRILKRTGDPGHEIILQTGFGPSGLPHIGTFGEVTRTTFVRRALADLGARSVRLFVFSDDMDGLRKVPLGFPAWLGEHLGRMLNEIPDPFGCCDSYSGHMNGKLEDMLRRFGFDYEFRSSAVQYKTGVFNGGLQKMLENVEKVRAIILPTLSPDKRAAWSPFLPVCSRCRRLYTTRVTAYHPDRSAIAYACNGALQAVRGCGNEGETTVGDGAVKVGWKADWALRWYVYGVTYEMYGKDLIESATLSGRIVEALGAVPPLGYFFELFLDETGAKISKSVGKGVTVDSWLRYAPVESLALFMFRNPRRAKRMFLGAIPQVVDELMDEVETHYSSSARTSGPAETASPRARGTYAFLNAEPPATRPYPPDLRYNLLLRLADTIAASGPEVLARYVKQVVGWPEGDDRAMRSLVEQAMLFRAEVEPAERKTYVPSGDAERRAIRTLQEYLAQPRTGDEIQARTYELGRELSIPSAALFKALYLIIIGQERGPRLGQFIANLGQDHVRALLTGALEAGA